MIPYHLIRSKRKTIAIQITGNATVEVRAPLKAPKDTIDHFVASKENWINKHIAVKKQNLMRKAAFQIHYGDSVLLLGKPYPMIEKEGTVASFDGEAFYMPPGLSAEEIKATVIQLYRAIAKKMLTTKVIDYAMQMNVQPLAVKVNGAKTRWGSCSSKNSLNFSWRLVMADHDVIDYVVVHELAHMREHNHSDRFWAVVAEVVPDYRERQLKLKELQKRLASEDWD